VDGAELVSGPIGDLMREFLGARGGQVGSALAGALAGGLGGGQAAHPEGTLGGELPRAFSGALSGEPTDGPWSRERARWN